MEQEQKSSNYLFAYEALKSAYPQMKGLRVRAQTLNYNYRPSQYQNQNKCDCIIFLSLIIGDGDNLTFITYQITPSGTVSIETTVVCNANTIHNYWFRACDVVIIDYFGYPMLNLVIYEPIL